MTKNISEKLKNYDFDYARIGVFDIDGILRGKLVSKEKLLSIIEKGFGFCNVVFAWDSNDKLYAALEKTGYPDEHAQLDLSSLRFMPNEKKRPFLLADFSDNKSGLGKACPRTLLKKVCKKVESAGYFPLFGVEYEWFNFAETPQSFAQKDYRNPEPITPGMFGYSLHRQALFQEYTDAILENTQQADVPVEGIHTETGDGVYEAALASAHALTAADRAGIFKNIVKETANQHGLIASFMAKWNENLPGCSGHLHQSIWDISRKKNLFSKKGKMSKLAASYLAGQLYCLPYIMPMFAPTVNSYKRFVKGSWAAVSVSWGEENRTTALRYITGVSEKSTRIETRVPGSDSNPYLAIAAALAAGFYGIENNLKLDTKPTTGSEYNNSSKRPLPRTLNEAIMAMEHSDIPVQLFGEDFTKHFIMTRQHEWAEYNKAVSDWELKRYFEVI